MSSRIFIDPTNKYSLAEQNKLIFSKYRAHGQSRSHYRPIKKTSSLLSIGSRTTSRIRKLGWLKIVRKCESTFWESIPEGPSLQNSAQVMIVQQNKCSPWYQKALFAMNKQSDCCNRIVKRIAILSPMTLRFNLS